MADDLLPPSAPARPSERPWQFSLLDLFGLMTVVSVGAAAFYWNPELGMLTSSALFLCIATFYRTKAVVRAAAPTLRSRALLSLIGFGIFTSVVACFAPFILTCGAVVSFSNGAPWSADAFFLGVGCVLGSIATLYVLSRSWPKRRRSK
ncbi:MAG: hypothetical protein K8R36_19960 [Planctomycetales bacterium]|nr:hypothetical protein [Planctomycetales bacterium]